MDLILSICDDLFLDKIWTIITPQAQSNPCQDGSKLHWTCSRFYQNLELPFTPSPSSASSYFPTPTSAWPRDYFPRQIASLMVLTLAGIHVLYFAFAGLSYAFIFNHDMMRHPRFIKNQVRLEIQSSLRAFPAMTALTLPWFLAEVRGYSRLYDNVSEYGWFYLVASVPFFLVFTDYCIYWIHRWLHLPFFYKHLHKKHHKWLIPTPFASHAFHPVDGFLQSVPYHIFIYLFPMHKLLYLVLFVLVNLWSILIHDSDMITGHSLEKVINGPAHHTLHHLYFTVNYGQYFTWADRFYDSYRQPDSSLDPLLEVAPEPGSQPKKKQ